MLVLTDGYADASASKCNGLVREKELEPWVGDGATNDGGLEAIEDTVVDGFDGNQVIKHFFQFIALHTLSCVKFYTRPLLCVHN